MDNIEVTPVLALRHSNKLKNSIINNIIPTIVKWRTKSIYYHSEIILDGKWISSNDNTGVVIRDLHELDHSEWDYITLPPHVITAEYHGDLWAYINSQDNKKYDFTGILFNQLIKLGKDNPDKWFCSELCTKVLQLIGYPTFMDKVPSEISPGDLAVICKKM